MKIFPLTAMLAATSILLPLSGTASPNAVNALPPDVPARHWAAGSVGRVIHEKIMGRDPDGRFRGDQPVTRYELAVTLDRFVRCIEDARKPLHAEIVPVPPALAAKAPPAARQAIQHLVANGFLKPDSPLLTQNGSGPATAAELSDALASVTIHLSDRAEPLPKN